MYFNINEFMVMMLGFMYLVFSFVFLVLAQCIYYHLNNWSFICM